MENVFTHHLLFTGVRYNLMLVILILNVDLFIVIPQRPDACWFKYQWFSAKVLLRVCVTRVVYTTATERHKLHVNCKYTNIR